MTYIVSICKEKGSNKQRPVTEIVLSNANKQQDNIESLSYVIEVYRKGVNDDFDYMRICDVLISLNELE